MLHIGPWLDVVPSPCPFHYLLLTSWMLAVCLCLVVKSFSDNRISGDVAGGKSLVLTGQCSVSASGLEALFLL